MLALIIIVCLSAIGTSSGLTRNEFNKVASSLK